MKIPATYYAGACLALLIVTQCSALQAQMHSPLPAATVGPPPQSPEEAKAVQYAAEANRADLHRKAIADADRLQQLATQLKDELRVSTPDTLPADVIKRAEEIERLARKVKKEAQA